MRRVTDVNAGLTMVWDDAEPGSSPMVSGERMYRRPALVAEAIARALVAMRARLEDLEALDDAWRAHCSRQMRAEVERRAADLPGPVRFDDVEF